MSSSVAEKKITLRSSDGEVFEVEESVAVLSQTIKHMIEDDCADNVIPLPNVTGKILSKVLEYCKRHVESDAASSAAKVEDKLASTATTDDDLKAFDADFVKVDQATLFDLILLCAAAVANVLVSLRVLVDCFTGFLQMNSVAVHYVLLKQFYLMLSHSPRLSGPAANYLNIKTLLDLTCQTVADMIKGKTPEEIRKTFNIKNDFTPEEEEEVRRENQWAFE
ncbi:hypothetical protein RD792_000917 [Penstemon davidsonii]|uniref:SKP1-like protein n=1 Tax=Penstemon davidsonii TaxID=160366 RepID=A0ABR0DMR1_9LAMI|nr:hypothetical protein RD792_000917 [Penstemon davidsonii]